MSIRHTWPAPPINLKLQDSTGPSWNLCSVLKKRNKARANAAKGAVQSNPVDTLSTDQKIDAEFERKLLQFLSEQLVINSNGSIWEQPYSDHTFDIMHEYGELYYEAVQAVKMTLPQAGSSQSAQLPDYTRTAYRTGLERCIDRCENIKAAIGVDNEEASIQLHIKNKEVYKNRRPRVHLKHRFHTFITQQTVNFSISNVNTNVGEHNGVIIYSEAILCAEKMNAMIRSGHGNSGSKDKILQIYSYPAKLREATQIAIRWWITNRGVDLGHYKMEDLNQTLRDSLVSAHYQHFIETKETREHGAIQSQQHARNVISQEVACAVQNTNSSGQSSGYKRPSKRPVQCAQSETPAPKIQKDNPQQPKTNREDSKIRNIHNMFDNSNVELEQLFPEINPKDIINADMMTEIQEAIQDTKWVFRSAGAKNRVDVTTLINEEDNNSAWRTWADNVLEQHTFDLPNAVHEAMKAFWIMLENTDSSSGFFDERGDPPKQTAKRKTPQGLLNLTYVGQGTYNRVWKFVSEPNDESSIQKFPPIIRNDLNKIVFRIPRKDKRNDAINNTDLAAIELYNVIEAAVGGFGPQLYLGAARVQESGDMDLFDNNEPVYSDMTNKPKPCTLILIQQELDTTPLNKLGCHNTSSNHKEQIDILKSLHEVVLEYSARRIVFLDCSLGNFMIGDAKRVYAIDTAPLFYRRIVPNDSTSVDSVEFEYPADNEWRCVWLYNVLMLSCHIKLNCPGIVFDSWTQLLLGGKQLITVIQELYTHANTKEIHDHLETMDLNTLAKEGRSCDWLMNIRWRLNPDTTKIMLDPGIRYGADATAVNMKFFVWHYFVLEPLSYMQRTLTKINTMHQSVQNSNRQSSSRGDVDSERIRFQLRDAVKNWEVFASQVHARTVKKFLQMAQHEEAKVCESKSLFDALIVYILDKTIEAHVPTSITAADIGDKNKRRNLFGLSDLESNVGWINIGPTKPTRLTELVNERLSALLVPEKPDIKLSVVDKTCCGLNQAQLSQLHRYYAVSSTKPTYFVPSQPWASQLLSTFSGS
tara:strand:- start:7109 stop:10225 length:3117 start_codon:yes stop_codon:yes gene_type:complete